MRVTRKHSLWLVLGFGLSAGLMACPAFPGDVCADVPGVCGGDGGGDGNAGDVKNDGPSVDAPPGCDLTKDPKDSPACIDDGVGVFVSTAGNDMDPGTKAKPVKTLTGALAKLAGKPRVYVCEGMYADSATITVPVSIYGALKCDWTAGGARPKITGTKPDYVVKVDGVSGTVQLMDVELYGKDGALDSGESSIALFANASGDVKLVRDVLQAANGGGGKSGTLMAFDFSMLTAQFLRGKDSPGTTGGPANPVSCPGGKTTTGGKGGDIGLDGDPGQAIGGGAKGNAGPMMGVQCSNGGAGQPGANGGDGLGGLLGGQLDQVGWHPNAGMPGQVGSPGGGGGGGGGQVNGGNSGGGGGGGAGGCGGAGGGNGLGGGASVAVSSLNSSLVLRECVLKGSSGGSGGAGASAQAGQSLGGSKGNGSFDGCSGGGGGAGGNGGAGGGGAGGVSVGILYKGTKPAYGNDTAVTVGTKGTGGTSPAGGASNGADGVAQAELMAP